MKRKSRYHDTPGFAADPRGNSDFKGVRPREIPAAPGIVEHVIEGGVRLDNLADNYYDNDRQWFRFGDANWGFMHAPDMALDLGKNHNQDTDKLGREDRVGKIILIPKAGA